MGKRGGWTTVVKKVFGCQTGGIRGKVVNWFRPFRQFPLSMLFCDESIMVSFFYDQKISKAEKQLGRRRSIDSDTSSTEDAVVVRAAHSPARDVKSTEVNNQQNQHAYNVALATAAAAEAAAAAAARAAAEVARLAVAARSLGKTKEELAAIKIQTAYRGYLARRALRALRGLVRLKSLVGGHSVKRQSATTLKCMQTLARVQSEVRSRRIRMSEENSALQRQIQQKREKELQKPSVSVGDNWNDSTQSKEKIEANIHYRQEAASKRERALAYAYSHQITVAVQNGDPLSGLLRFLSQTWRGSSNSATQTFMDPRNPRWGWSWLERWMASRPWENVNATDKELNSDHISVKSATSRSISSRRDTKLQSPTARKLSQPSTRQSPSTPDSKAARRVRPTSLGNGMDDESKSVKSAQSDRCRRHSTAGSSVRDDESLASSPAGVPSYMASTESTRARSRPSPLGSAERVRTPEKAASSGSAKKRLSFSDSPAGPRRHSGPAKTVTSPAKDATKNPQ
ncbi:UNVERIFIED_CONTAM: protein IQ-DOMAIN 1 [Sesamum radiatum]|uniref:Protein IQ-DOMAIN 1 n=1 Tax=Sesamum radiatum TaxID=300843 RepID=A0AAW2JVH0_SESRA